MRGGPCLDTGTRAQGVVGRVDDCFGVAAPYWLRFCPPIAGVWLRVSSRSTCCEVGVTAPLRVCGSFPGGSCVGAGSHAVVQ